MFGPIAIWLCKDYSAVKHASAVQLEVMAIFF